MLNANSILFSIRPGDRVVQRIVELVGSRTNGVWSTQIEVEYGRKFKGETLPEKWPAALERLDASMAKLRVDRPIPGDNGRCIILPNLHHTNNSSGDPLTVDTAAAAAVKAVKTPQASPIVVGEFNKTGIICPSHTKQFAASVNCLPYRI